MGLEPKVALQQVSYDDDEPVPVEVSDLGDLVAQRPSGPVTAALSWSRLDDAAFERLLFNLINSTEGYENPSWLTATNAPDRGRDLAVWRVGIDKLSGTERRRVLIQCKHWLKKSVSLVDASTLIAQAELWRNPPFNVVVIATTGRFTTDAIDWIEKRNEDGLRPYIEMWPESHMESLLASRPDLVAEAKLR